MNRFIVKPNMSVKQIIDWVRIKLIGIDELINARIVIIKDAAK